MHAVGAQNRTQVLVSDHVKWETYFKMQMVGCQQHVCAGSGQVTGAEKPKQQKAEMQQSAEANCCHT